MSKQEVTFPIVMKTNEDYFMKREVIANTIYSEEEGYKAVQLTKYIGCNRIQYEKLNLY